MSAPFRPGGVGKPAAPTCSSSYLGRENRRCTRCREDNIGRRYILYLLYCRWNERWERLKLKAFPTRSDTLPTESKDLIVDFAFISCKRCGFKVVDIASLKYAVEHFVLLVSTTLNHCHEGRRSVQFYTPSINGQYLLSSKPFSEAYLALCSSSARFRCAHFAKAGMSLCLRPSKMLNFRVSGD
jgi:hypothetical protein